MKSVVFPWNLLGKRTDSALVAKEICFLQDKSSKLHNVNFYNLKLINNFYYLT